MPILSVVVPSRNEADSVGMLISELEPVIEDSAELIFVDDSDDDTPARVLEHGRAARESVRLVHREPHRCGPTRRASGRRSSSGT